MKGTILVAIGVLICLSTPLETKAGIVATSNFDTGLDGWSGYPSGEITPEASGGNPEGYVRFEDDSGNSSSISAPSKFLGDWSCLNDGLISYNHKLFQAGDGVQGWAPYRINISGLGGEAKWEGATPSGITEWVNIEVPLVETEWTVTSGSWEALLNDVGALRIGIEMVNNQGHGEIDGIDNVILRSSIAVIDTDSDCILDDGDNSGVPGDNLCTTGIITNCDDNCPETPNGPRGGTCTLGDYNKLARPCMDNIECGIDGFCSRNQEETDGDGIGDACDLCEGNFDCDADCDGLDLTTFLFHFGRGQYFEPCTNLQQCKGDFLCDGDVDGEDVSTALECFGRGQYSNPCPPCPGGDWCVYP